MNQAPKSLQWLVWGSMAVTIAAILVAFVITKSRESKTQLSRAVSDSVGAPRVRPVLFKVPDFTLTNQNGRVVTGSDLRGQIWVADIIFTRCAGPCPEMTQRMTELQGAVAAGDPVRFVTLTTDPEFDTPPVLHAYGRRFGADPERWHFLTGTKRQIADLAVGGLKLTALDKEKDKQENLNDLFVHSTLFVLVDKQGQARGVFESDEADMKSEILQAIDQLLKEK